MTKGVLVHVYKQTEPSPSYFCINCRVCPSFHNLNYIQNFQFIYRNSKQSFYPGIMCDVCKVGISFEKNTKILKCLDCEWDVCNKCESKLFYRIDKY